MLEAFLALVLTSSGAASPSDVDPLPFRVEAIRELEKNLRTTTDPVERTHRELLLAEAHLTVALHVHLRDVVEWNNAYEAWFRDGPSTGAPEPQLKRDEEVLKHATTAATLFQKVIETDASSEMPDAYEQLAECYSLLERPEDERKTLETLVALHPPSSVACAAYQSLAMTAFEDRDLVAARKYDEQALANGYACDGFLKWLEENLHFLEPNPPARTPTP